MWRSSNPADSNDHGKVHYGFNDLAFPRTPPPNVAKEIKSYGAVLRWPKSLLKLPAGTDFSMFHNRSENFTPLGGRVNGFGEPQPSLRGKTTEYGFDLSTLGGKITLRVNQFETSVQGQSYTPGVYGSTITNAILQTIARMLPVWNQLRNRPQSTYPTGWQIGDPAPSGSYGAYLDSLVLVPFATALATEGSASAEQRKWRANLITRWASGRDSVFGEKLKGWSIGGAVRWQDKLGIGYPTRRNPDGSVTLDLKHPFDAPPETNVDAFVSYERKLSSNRINWKVQLNVRNLYGDSTTIPVGVQPWGAPSTVRLAPERRWYLGNTLTF